MQLSLREAGMALPLRGGVETGADEIERLMRQMRAWQDSYASVLNLLPYPIFFEQDGKIVLSNRKPGASCSASTVNSGGPRTGCWR